MSSTTESFGTRKTPAAAGWSVPAKSPVWWTSIKAIFDSGPGVAKRVGMAGDGTAPDKAFRAKSGKTGRF